MLNCPLVVNQRRSSGTGGACSCPACFTAPGCAAVAGCALAPHLVSPRASHFCCLASGSDAWDVHSRMCGSDCAFSSVLAQPLAARVAPLSRPFECMCLECPLFARSCVFTCIAPCTRAFRRTSGGVTREHASAIAARLKRRPKCQRRSEFGTAATDACDCCHTSGHLHIHPGTSIQQEGSGVPRCRCRAHGCSRLAAADIYHCGLHIPCPYAYAAFDRRRMRFDAAAGIAA